MATHTADPPWTTTDRAKAEGKLRPGEVYVVNVRHDDGCDLVSGQGGGELGCRGHA